MGTVIDLEGVRRKRRRSESSGDILISTPNGECSGCGALRSTVTIFHDTGLPEGSSGLFLTLPHWKCDGENVISQEPSVEEMEAEIADLDGGTES